MTSGLMPKEDAARPQLNVRLLPADLRRLKKLSKAYELPFTDVVRILIRQAEAFLDAKEAER